MWPGLATSVLAESSAELCRDLSLHSEPGWVSDKSKLGRGGEEGTLSRKEA